MVAMPRTSIEALLGVLPLVVRVTSRDILGPSDGGAKLAVTPVGSEPVLRVVSPV